MANSAAMLYLKYGRLRVSVKEVAQELGLTHGTVRNQISDGTFPIPSYVEGRNRFVDVRELGRYLDACYQQAQASLSSEMR
ncbi:helix-turn-helix transcriptional regulator [Alcaligenes sp. RM2]